MITVCAASVSKKSWCDILADPEVEIDGQLVEELQSKPLLELASCPHILRIDWTTLFSYKEDISKDTSIFIALATFMIPSIKHDVLRQATLMYQIDWRLTMLLIEDAIRSDSEMLELIRVLIALRQKCLLAMDLPMMQKLFFSTPYPVFSRRIPSVIPEAPEQLASGSDLDRILLLMEYAPQSVHLVPTCFQLRSLIGLVNASLCPLHSGVHLIDDFLTFTNGSDIRQWPSQSYAISGHFVFSQIFNHNSASDVYSNLKFLALTHVNALKSAGTLIAERLLMMHDSHPQNQSGNDILKTPLPDIFHKMPWGLQLGVLERLEVKRSFLKKILKFDVSDVDFSDEGQWKSCLDQFEQFLVSTVVPTDPEQWTLIVKGFTLHMYVKTYVKIDERSPPLKGPLLQLRQFINRSTHPFPDSHVSIMAQKAQLLREHFLNLFMSIGEVDLAEFLLNIFCLDRMDDPFEQLTEELHHSAQLQDSHSSDFLFLDRVMSIDSTAIPNAEHEVNQLSTIATYLGTLSEYTEHFFQYHYDFSNMPMNPASPSYSEGVQESLKWLSNWFPDSVSSRIFNIIMQNVTDFESFRMWLESLLRLLAVHVRLRAKQGKRSRLYSDIQYTRTLTHLRAPQVLKSIILLSALCDIDKKKRNHKDTGAVVRKVSQRDRLFIELYSAFSIFHHPEYRTEFISHLMKLADDFHDYFSSEAQIWLATYYFVCECLHLPISNELRDATRPIFRHLEKLFAKYLAFPDTTSSKWKVQDARLFQLANIVLVLDSPQRRHYHSHHLRQERHPQKPDDLVMHYHQIRLSQRINDWVLDNHYEVENNDDNIIWSYFDPFHLFRLAAATLNESTKNPADQMTSNLLHFYPLTKSSEGTFRHVCQSLMQNHLMLYRGPDGNDESSHPSIQGISVTKILWYLQVLIYYPEFGNSPFYWGNKLDNDNDDDDDDYSSGQNNNFGLKSEQFQIPSIKNALRSPPGPLTKSTLTAILPTPLDFYWMMFASVSTVSPPQSFNRGNNNNDYDAQLISRLVLSECIKLLPNIDKCLLEASSKDVLCMRAKLIAYLYQSFLPNSCLRLLRQLQFLTENHLISILQFISNENFIKWRHSILNCPRCQHVHNIWLREWRNQTPSFLNIAKSSKAFSYNLLSSGECEFTRYILTLMHRWQYSLDMSLRQGNDLNISMTYGFPLVEGCRSLSRLNLTEQGQSTADKPRLKLRLIDSVRAEWNLLRLSNVKYYISHTAYWLAKIRLAHRLFRSLDTSWSALKSLINNDKNSGRRSNNKNCKNAMLKKTSGGKDSIMEGMERISEDDFLLFLVLLQNRQSPTHLPLTVRDLVIVSSGEENLNGSPLIQLHFLSILSDLMEECDLARRELNININLNVDDDHHKDDYCEGNTFVASLTSCITLADILSLNTTTMNSFNGLNISNDIRMLIHLFYLPTLELANFQSFSMEWVPLMLSLIISMKQDSVEDLNYLIRNIVGVLSLRCELSSCHSMKNKDEKIVHLSPLNEQKVTLQLISKLISDHIVPGLSLVSSSTTTTATTSSSREDAINLANFELSYLILRHFNQLEDALTYFHDHIMDHHSGSQQVRIQELPVWKEMEEYIIVLGMLGITNANNLKLRQYMSFHEAKLEKNGQ